MGSEVSVWSVTKSENRLEDFLLFCIVSGDTHVFVFKGILSFTFNLFLCLTLISLKLSLFLWPVSVSVRHILLVFLYVFLYLSHLGLADECLCLGRECSLNERMIAPLTCFHCTHFRSHDLRAIHPSSLPPARSCASAAASAAYHVLHLPEKLEEKMLLWVRH